MLEREPSPSPADLRHPGIEPGPPQFQPQADSSPAEPQGRSPVMGQVENGWDAVRRAIALPDVTLLPKNQNLIKEEALDEPKQEQSTK